MTQATIVSWGQAASAIAAILGLVGLILIKPLRAAAKRRKEEADSRAKFQREVLDKLEIDPALLGKVYESPEVTGTVHTDDTESVSVVY